LSENESLKKLLESAEQTLRYWREQHDRYQQKKQLNLKRLFLKRELTWVKISVRENAVSNLQGYIKIKEREILKIENEMKSKENELIDISEKLHDLKDGYRSLLEERIKYEREKAEQESTVSATHEVIKNVKLSQKKMDFCIDRIDNLEMLLSDSLQKQLTEIKSTHRTLQNTWIQQSALKSELIRSLTKQIREMTSRILDVQKRTNETSLEIEEFNKKSLDNQINSALLLHRRNLLTKSLEEKNKTLQVSLVELDEAIKKAEMEDGPRIVTLKKVEEILDEMRVTDGHLAALDDIREDVEHIYESYSKLYLELKEKIRIVSENREKALEEVKTRMRSWRSIIQTLLAQANLRYLTILSESQATGNVRVTNEHDIEAAGLEIHVGFKGTDPVPLNAYTQSGGERSTATMAFLLALQQHVRSPFRAVDEYDIHMDPKNRESIARVLISSVKDSSAQYVAITPSQITFMERGVHIITVQNVDGASLVKEAV
jgi:chromosome segregation protein